MSLVGGKSPLAYSDSFDIITRFDGIEYHYTLSKGTSVPELKHLAEFNTTERNGTEIKIPVNESDLGLFENGLITQLCYFDNVYFDNWNIDNNYIIFEGKTFKVRDSYQYSDELHIALGNVAYPINWNAIGMKEIKIPVAVKFNIGELEVTPSREELRYTEETKSIVKQRIEECLTDLRERFQKQNESTDDFMVYLQNRHKSGVLTLSGNGHELKLKMPKDFGIPLKFIPFEEAGIECPEDPFFEYELSGRIETKRGLRGANKGYQVTTAYGTIFDTVFREFKNITYNKVGIYSNYTINQVKLAYYQRVKKCDLLPWIISDSRKYTFHSKITQLGLSTERTSKRDNRIFYNNSMKVVQLGAFKKLYIYRKVIREFLQKYVYIDNEIEVPEDFKKAYRAEITNTEAAKRRKAEQRISVKYCTYLYPTKPNNFDVYWDRKDIKIDSIANHTDIIVYGFEDDKDKFKEATSLFLHRKSFLKYNKDDSLDTISGNYRNEVPRLNDKAIKFYIISKANEKYFKNNHKVVYVDNLVKNNTVLKDVATAYYLKDKFYLRESMINNFEEINTSIYNKIKEIEKFVEENTVYQVDSWKGQRTNLFMRQAVEDAIDRKYLNQDILKIDNQIEKYFEKVEILKHVEITDNNKKDIISYLRRYNKKTNVVIRSAPDLEFSFPLVIPKPEAREVELPKPHLISEDDYIADYSLLINLN
ncbi:MAG: hypothetical protein JST04_00810 [Bdellovibrionales bacterium]|nr:hypothetical protein [Bdellovibrionales bacterium]